MAEDQNLVATDDQIVQASITDNPNQPIIYSNMCGVQFGPEDVTLQFAIRDTTDPNHGFAVSRVYSNVSNMKRFIFVLNKSLKDYEDVFGPVSMDPAERITPEGLRRFQEQQKKKGNDI